MPSPGVVMACVGAVTSAIVGIYWPTATLFCVPAVLGALTVPVIDLILRAGLRGYALLAARALLVVVVAIVIAVQCAWSPTESFRRAFSIDPPAGVTKLEARARGAGPGDVVAHIRFRAPRSTLDAIVTARGLRRDPLRESSPDWSFAVDPIARFAVSNGDEQWVPPSFLNAEIYQSPDTPHSHEKVHLFYNPATGEAWALYLRG